MSNNSFMLPVAFAQRRLWFVDPLIPENAFYDLHAAAALRTSPSCGDLHKLNGAARHPAEEATRQEAAALPSIDRTTHSHTVAAARERGIPPRVDDAPHRQRRLVDGGILARVERAPFESPAVAALSASIDTCGQKSAPAVPIEWLAREQCRGGSQRRSEA